MERFADELQRGFAARSDYRMSALRVHPSDLARRGGLGRPAGYAARLVRYPLAVRNRAADIFHVCDHSYSHIAAWTPPERTVISCHDLMPLVAAEIDRLPKPPRRTVAMFRWRVSYLARVARVVCDSESTKRDVMRLCGVPEARIAVVAPGVAPHFRPLPVTRPRMAGAHTIVHVSNGAAYKNVSATLEVLAGLDASGLEVALHRVGPGLNGAKRETARQLGVERMVVEHGAVSETELVSLYQRADVVLFPSFYEGFGWPPLEAMACGTPVVTSDCPALVELVGDAALTAAPGDTAGLTTAVRSILESEDLRARLRARGLQRARRFTWARAIDGYARIYGGVAGS